jgi:hypothetical protein
MVQEVVSAFSEEMQQVRELVAALGQEYLAEETRDPEREREFNSLMRASTGILHEGTVWFKEFSDTLEVRIPRVLVQVTGRRSKRLRVFEEMNSNLVGILENEIPKLPGIVDRYKRVSLQLEALVRVGRTEDE